MRFRFRLSLGILAALLIVFAGCSFVDTQEATGSLDVTGRSAGSEWQLVWQDEFNQNSLDLNNWDFDLGDGSAVGIPGWGNGELQYYTNESQNVFIRDNKLVIRAIKEDRSDDLGEGEYTSARLVTRGLQSFKYGRFEARMKLPAGEGLWPALWMLPEYDGGHASGKYGGWAASGEIDIMEARGSRTNQVTGAIHYGGEWPNNTYSSGSYTWRGRNVGTITEFNDFALEWEPGEIRWYINGINYFTATNWHSTGGDFPAPFDQPFHLLVNLAVGGFFDGDPADNADYFPAEMEIDYIRVYQLGDGSGDNGGDDGGDDGSGDDGDDGSDDGGSGGPPSGRGPNR
ncbi:glycoside hydrolase family 16 protein [Spirochaeta dissipatitropha]